MFKLVKYVLPISLCWSLLNCMDSTPVANPSDETIPKDKPEYDKILLIANFDDGDIMAAPKWWTFGDLELNSKETNATKFGRYHLELNGKTDNYYIGGQGTYVGKDASDLDTLVVSVYGHGEDSGMIRLQVYDDDNNSYQLEQDATFKPLYDDHFEYELPVSWEGWRMVEIPLNKFVDVNPGVGDDVLNPDQKNGSGGLLHFQFVVFSNKEKGSVNLGLDNIKLVKKN